RRQSRARHPTEVSKWKRKGRGSRGECRGDEAPPSPLPPRPSTLASPPLPSGEALVKLLLDDLPAPRKPFVVVPAFEAGIIHLRHWLARNLAELQCQPAFPFVRGGPRRDRED